MREITKEDLPPLEEPSDALERIEILQDAVLAGVMSPEKAQALAEMAESWVMVKTVLDSSGHDEEWRESLD